MLSVILFPFQEILQGYQAPPTFSNPSLAVFSFQRKNKYTASAKKKRPPFGERIFRWKLATTTQRSRKPIVKLVFALCAQWVNLRNVLDLDFRVALVALCLSHLVFLTF